jgi:hypothetical protein
VSITEMRRPRTGRAEYAALASGAPAIVALLSLPFLRPNLFGESLSVIGFGLMAAAAFLSVFRPESGYGDAGRGPRPVAVGGLLTLIVCLGLSYVWLMVKASAVHPADHFRPALQGLVLTVGTLGALAVVCRDQRNRLALARGFVLVITALCASYAVTALLWTVLGVGSGQISTVLIGSTAEPFYFPFTPSQSVQTLFGVQFPRFSGLGREPGWMAMYCAVAYFMADLIPRHRRLVKLLLIVGLLGCISTAGFGVFVVVWAYRTCLSDRGTGISMAQYLRQLFGIGAMAAAIWVATEAPVLGLSAKASQNETSLDERLFATQAGLRALSEQPLGGLPTEAQAGINLIADIAVGGLPFVLFVCGGLLLPLLWRGRASTGNAVVLVVFLTLLLAQPAKDSTWAYGVVALALALNRSDISSTTRTGLGDDRERS